MTDLPTLIALARAAKPTHTCTCSDDYGPVSPYCDGCLAHNRAFNAYLDAVRESATVLALCERVQRLEAVAELALAVVNERRVKLMHARESTAMCRLSKALSALTPEAVGL